MIDTEELKKGLVLGIVAGLIFGIIDSVFRYYFGGMTLTPIYQKIYEIVSFSLGPIYLANVIEGMIVWSILGLVFSLIYKRIPLKTIETKSILYSIIWWFVLRLIPFIGVIMIPIITWSFYSIVQNILTGIVGFIFWGLIVGYLWKKF